MRQILKLIVCFTRGVRQMRPPGQPVSVKKQEPVEWLKVSTTYADTHSAVLDPFTSQPYPEEDLEEVMRTSEKAAALRRRRKKERRRQPNYLNFDHIPIDEQVFVLFPGQGSQHVGMGAKTAGCSQAMSMYEQASEILGYDLKKLCLEGPKTKLDQTIYCQPAVFVSSLAAWEKVKQSESEITHKVTHAAGFSVGEFTALVLAGVLSFADAVRLVKIRAEAMHECNQIISSGMLTVRVSAKSQLEEAMHEARKVAAEKHEREICEISNYLFCGVKVIGASETCMRFLEENQDRYNFKVVKRLAVSGAFHTSLMNDAAEPFKKALKEVQINKPVLNVYSNYTGKEHSQNFKEIRYDMIKQIYSPVKWEQILQELYHKHQDYKFPRFLEVGPGRQLGMMLHQISKKAYAHYENYPP